MAPRGLQGILVVEIAMSRHMDAVRIACAKPLLSREAVKEAVASGRVEKLQSKESQTWKTMRRVGKSFANGWRFRRTSDRRQIRPRTSPKGPSSRTSFSAAAASRTTESWDGCCRASAGRDRSSFTRTSYNDFEIVAANILDNDQRRVTDRITAFALYTDPPLGHVGMTEAEIRKTGTPALISTMPMEDVSRAFEKGETKGFMKILVDRDSKQILGASFLGLAGDEVIQCILDLMYAEAPYTVMQRAMHIHPTVSEFIPTMMGELKPLQ